MRLHGRMAAALLVLATGWAARVGAEPLECRRVVLSESGKFAQARMKALLKCEAAKRKGALAPATICGSEPKTVEALAKAEMKLHVNVAKACGGEDGDCGTPGDGNDAPAALGWPAGCPDFMGLGCPGPITDCTDVAECLRCVTSRIVEHAVQLYHDAQIETAPGSRANKCQVAIGKAAGTFFAAKTKALTKCWDARLKDKHDGLCVPPADGDGKYLEAIAKAGAKSRVAIAKACGEQPVAAIGFAPQCPSVRVPNGAACDAAVGDVAALGACVGCVTEFDVDCGMALAVPAFQTYPSECLAPPAPTPTVVTTATATTTPAVTASRTASATPTVTATATVTVTRTPTPTRTASATPLVATPTRTATPSPTPTGPRCGDGVRQRPLGEDCDDGNNLNCDACPADCHEDFDSCSVTGTYVQPVRIQAPVGTPLGGATICLEYPHGTVSLPQNASDQVPTNRIGYAGGFFSAVDFENAVQIALTQSPADDGVDLTLTFDRCGTAPIPPPTSYACRTVTASDDLGTALDPVRVACTANTP